MPLCPNSVGAYCLNAPPQLAPRFSSMFTLASIKHAFISSSKYPKLTAWVCIITGELFNGTCRHIDTLNEQSPGMAVWKMNVARFNETIIPLTLTSPVGMWRTFSQKSRESWMRWVSFLIFHETYEKVVLCSSCLSFQSWSLEWIDMWPRGDRRAMNIK